MMVLAVEGKFGENKLRNLFSRGSKGKHLNDRILLICGCRSKRSFEAS